MGSEDLSARIDAATWPARLAELARSAEALADDMSQLAAANRGPDRATLATGRRVAVLASELAVGARSMASTRPAPRFSAMATQAGVLHDLCEQLRVRVADLTVTGRAPSAKDAVAAAELVQVVAHLRALMARKAELSEPRSTPGSDTD